MSVTNQMSVSLVGVGGTAPYAFTVVAGANTTIPATISGSTLTVDATSLEPGNYTVEVRITDQTGTDTTKIITVNVLDQNQLAILNRDATYEPNVFPSPTTIQLQSVGGTGTITWSLVPAVTSLPGAAINGSILSFTLNSFGQWAVGVRATDSLGNTVTRVLSIAVVASAVVSVVDGHALLQVNATDEQVGTHQFTLTVVDSATSAQQATFNYTVEPKVSGIDIPEATINHFWGAADATNVVLPIAGDLSGFSIGSTTPVVAANGLTVTVDASTNSLIVSGPPTSFGNAEVDVPIAIVQGTTQVATVTREFTLVSHNGSTSSLGNMTCSTRPYIVGELVGLNPERPYFNSPSIFKNSGYTVQLAQGSALPLGLSLDSVTGLIYGNVLAADVTSSTLNYLDSTGTVQGTVTVKWDIVASQFQLMDNLVDGQLQAAYSGNLTTSSAVPLAGASVYRGKLPFGLALGISTDHTEVTLTGTPTVAGYFDLWIKAVNTNGQAAYIQKRLVVDYIAPLAVVTDSMQRLITGSAFTQTLHVVGGEQPYTWSLASGTLPTGLTLDANAGTISGTTTDTVYSQTITIAVTDARGVTASRSLAFAINNALTITTPVLPLIIPGQFYQFQLQAEGGTGAYTWSLGSGSSALPGGFTLSSSGVLSGATSLESFSANIIIQVTDAANNVTTQAYALSIGTTSGLIIDTEGIGPMVRGQAYQGTVKVLGTGLAPFYWGVSTDSPNQLPAGFTFTGDQSNNGATATLAGKTTVDLLNYSVKIHVVDANGNQAFAFLMLNTYTSLLITTTSPLPQATVSGDYSVQLTASGVNSPFTWSLDPSSPTMAAGMSLSSSGVLSGPSTAATDTTLIFRVTDALGDYAIKPLEFISKVSTLAISTSSLPQGTAGVGYNVTLAATGGAPGYRWSVSPNSAAVLPAGLSLNPSTGVISGTTLAAGFNGSITFRVTDSIDVYREKTFSLTVVSALRIYAGPDYVQGTSLGYLGLVARGDVSSINPRSNRSFNVILTNVISATAGGLTFGLPQGFSASVLSLANGVAIVNLTGPFSGGAIGDNTFNFSVSDSGVNGSAALKWKVFTENAISVVPASGSLPVLFS